MPEGLPVRAALRTDRALADAVRGRSADCPRNGRQLQPPPDCVVEVDAAYAEGLGSLDGRSAIWCCCIGWGRSRPMLLTISPAFDRAAARGVRNAGAGAAEPDRAERGEPAWDVEGARLTVRNLDCRDGTPLLDIKPYLPSTDHGAGGFDGVAGTRIGRGRRR